MKRVYIIATKLAGLLASIALMLGVASTQAVCVMIYHQPKVPQEMSRFNKER